MSKMIFMLFVSCDQDNATGTPTLDHMSRKLQTLSLFSHKFDVSKESDLKTAINDVRSDIFGSYIDEANGSLVDGDKKYIIGRTKTVANLHQLKGKVTVPVEITLEIDQLIVDDNGFYNLHDAKVVNVKRLASRVCMHPKAYTSWTVRRFCEKNIHPKRKNPNTAMAQAFQRAANEK